MIQSLLLHILAAIAGLWIATRLIEGAEFQGSPQLLLIAGLILGMVNATLKPLLNLVTFPIRILTLGLSSFVIGLLLVWMVDILFPELTFVGFLPLLWTTLIIWLITIPLSLLARGKA